MGTLEVRPMRMGDVRQMTRWGAHIDPRFLHYNFPYHSTFDLVTWYMVKNNQVTKRLYGGFVDDRLVGYAVLKAINWLTREGEMGISLNPDLLDMGLGQQLVEGFLVHVFEKLRMQRVYLRTARFNHRAIAVYEKRGFILYKQTVEPFESQAYAEKCYERFPEDFGWEGPWLTTTYLWMEIARKFK